MAKVQKLFRFSYCFERTVVKNARNIRERLPVEVIGYGYYNTLSIPQDPLEARYSVDIESIAYDGVSDVKPVIEYFELDGELKQAVIQYVSELFEEERRSRYSKLPNMTGVATNLKSLIKNS